MSPDYHGDFRHYQRPPEVGGAAAAFVIVIFILGLTASIFALSFGWISIDVVRRDATARGTAQPTAMPGKLLAVLDWDIPNGHFYTQTNGEEQGTKATGFSVTNADGAAFWDEFQKQGGVTTIGYPVTSRFQWRGMITQVFQRAVMQYNPEIQQIDFVNIMDELSLAGKDDWLLKEFQIPKSVPADFDVGRTWEQARDNRMLFIGKSQALKDKYLSVSDPLKLFGLPSSAVEEMTDNKAIRLQRGVLRQWTVDKPGVKAGDVTAVNVGEILLQSGLLTTATTTPEPGEPPDSTKSAASGGIIVTEGSATVQPTAPEPTPQPTMSPLKYVKIGHTNGDGVFIRKTPNLNDRLVAWPDNTQLQVIGTQVESGGIKWYHVQDPRGNQGYVPAQYIIEQ